MARKKSPATKWGTPADQRLERVGGWVVGTRRFDCQDGTSFYQYKVVRAGAVCGFDDMLSSVFGWVSKLVDKRTVAEFSTREAAHLAGLAEVTRLRERFGDQSGTEEP